MKLRSLLRWELLLAFTLVGCASLVPNTPQGAIPTALGPAADSEAPGATETLGGTVFMRIQWPALPRKTQTIPDTATSLEITLRKKDGTTLASRRLPRPAGETPVSTASFKVNPALGVIDIEAIARRDDTILARGLRKDVPVRHNTATGVAITLDTDASLQIRLERQLVILKDLQHYFQRFSDWLNYPASDEARTMTNALTTMFQQAGRDAYDVQRAMSVGPWPEPHPLSTPTRAVERWISSARAGYAMDLADQAITKLLWPGYEATLDFQGGAPRRQFDVGIAAAQGQGDPSRAGGYLEVTANWVKEPLLTGVFTGQLDGVGEPSTRSFRLFDGERPAWDTITSLAGEAYFSPQGQRALGAGAQVKLDGFANATNSALVKGFSNLFYYPPTFPTLNWPTHGFGTVDIPSAAATADIRLDSAFSQGVANAVLAIKDNQGNRSTFRTRLEASITPPTLPYRLFQTGRLTFVLEDQSEALRVEGTFECQLDAPAITVKAKLLDTLSGTIIGTVDYTMPLRDGTFEPYHNDSWPYLVLMDGPNGTASSSIQLNPGLLTGQTTGYVGISMY